MDSNVSKTTFFYKFIKLQLNQKNWAIKDLLKQDLLRTIDLYTQRQNIDIDLRVIAKDLDRKIFPLQSSYLASFSNNCDSKINSKLQFTNLLYRCAIAFPLTSYCQLSPQHIAQELTQNMGSLACSNFKKIWMRGNSVISPSSLTNDRFLEFAVIVHTSGYIDFYLIETSVAIWLEEFLEFLVAKSLSPPIYAPISIEQPKNTLNLVPLQYVHARCCSLLHLGEREKLIELGDRNFEYLIWHIAQPHAISWLNTEGRLWLSQTAEWNLLLQLLKVADASVSKSNNWYKLASNLSQAMVIFDAECRIMGEVKQKFPQKALARLGLVALVQYWLQQLLYFIQGS